MGVLRDSEGFPLATKPADIAVAKYLGTYPYLDDPIDIRLTDDGCHTLYFAANGKTCRLQVDSEGVVVLTDSGPIYTNVWR